MRFGQDVYGRYCEDKHGRAAIEWYPWPSTWRRPAWIPNLIIAPFFLGWHISKKTGIRWNDD